MRGTRSSYSKVFGLAVLLWLCVSTACPRFIASYDAKTEEEIFRLSKVVDEFYGQLLEKPAKERAYSSFADVYVKIEADLNSLVLRNKVRQLNEDSTDIAERILGLWHKYKERHKSSGGYPDGVAKLDRARFKRMFEYAAGAEGAKKLE